ncbi:MAG: hypothetical protein EOP56_09435 [Sphingobacteriales bacterium]|nr:MAG: hypothetical protein EOP56_09435 [Sphingobacteriales bacterium]
MAENQVVYEVSLRDRNVNTQLQSFDRNANRFERSIRSADSALSSFGKGAIAALGTFTIFDIIRDSIGEFDAAAKATGQLNAALKSTGGIAGVTMGQLIDQAEALQKVTLFDDDSTKGAQSLLLTFTNIRDEIFTEAIPAIQDLATRMGTDLNGAAVQVGKALNDPIQGINALRRVGVSFTKDQRKVIETLVRTGKVAEAQRLILKELNTEFGGSAREAALAGAGAFQILQNEIGDIKEDLGELALELVREFNPGIKQFVKSFKDGVKWLREHKEGVKEIVTTAAKLIPVYLEYRALIWSLTKAEAALLLIQQLRTREMGRQATMGAAAAGSGAGGALASSGQLFGYAAAGAFIYQVSGEMARVIEEKDWFGDMFRKRAVQNFWEKQGSFAKENPNSYTAEVYYEQYGNRLVDAMEGGIDKNIWKLSQQFENIGKIGGQSMVSGIKEQYLKVAQFMDNIYKGTPLEGSFSSAYYSTLEKLYDYNNKEKAGGKGRPPIPNLGGGTVDKIHGNQPVTINVKIDKQIETLEIHAQNMTEGLGKLKEGVQDAMSAAIRDSQILAGR